MVIGLGGVGNHTSDWQNRTTAKWESDLLITGMITDRIGQQDALSPIDHNQKVKVSFVIFKYDNYKQNNLEKWLLRLWEQSSEINPLNFTKSPIWIGHYREWLAHVTVRLQLD